MTTNTEGCGRPTRRKSVELADREAEREVLSAAFATPAEYARALLSSVAPDAWSLDRHRYVAAAMAAIAERGTPIEPVVLRQELVDAGHWEAIGGVNGLTHILEQAGAVYNAPEYAKRVTRKALERQMLAVWQGGAGDVVAGDLDACTLRAQAIGELTTKLRELDAPPMNWAQRVAVVGDAVRNPTRRVVYSTGLRNLDERLYGGWRPGWVVVVLGEAKKGKTALMSGNFSAQLMRDGLPVIEFSEMSWQEKIARWLAGESGVPLQAQAKGDLSPAQHGAFAAAEDRVAAWRCEVHPLGTFVRMAEQARAFRRRHGQLGAVVIDYLQLVDNGRENRVLDLEQTTRGCKMLAQEIDCVVFLLSQPDKASAQGGELGLHSGKGAGSIASDCDVMLIPTRDRKDPMRAGICVPGFRHGPAFVLEVGSLRFNGARMVFEETP